MDCAKSVLEFAHGDEIQLRKIWLQIAKHVVREKNDIKTAMEFLQVKGAFINDVMKPRDESLSMERINMTRGRKPSSWPTKRLKSDYEISIKLKLERLISLAISGLRFTNHYCHTVTVFSSVSFLFAKVPVEEKDSFKIGESQPCVTTGR